MDVLALILHTSSYSQTLANNAITFISCFQSGVANYAQLSMLSKDSIYYLTSQLLEITVWRDGMEYMQTYSRGKPVSILKCLVLPDERKDLRGTRVRFWPDKEGLYYMVMLFQVMFFCFLWQISVLHMLYFYHNMQYSPLLFSLITTQQLDALGNQLSSTQR